MPIDPDVALNAEPRVDSFEWTSSDVLLYHLGLGAGTPPTDPRELRYATEPDLQVLPTFGIIAPTVHATEAPKVESPGISIDLQTVVHGSQRIDVTGPIPTSGSATLSTRVTGVYDKGSAAVVVTESSATAADGTPLWTGTSSIFARGAGGFGGDRGPSSPATAPERPADHVIVTPTVPSQALLYRLLGDRNPLHSDPSFAAAAGFPAPILHGLCTYGMVCKAVVDELLDGDVAAVAGYGVRFAGVVFPGETLRTSVWREDGRLLIATTVDERDAAPALAGASLDLRP
ncbi:MaoC/PaaZ C-terminal domain-containing protein [Jatrophihabitans sp.]|uniref:MaoC/PaaZ C-terminal domain-containing protein n=1 Tax=Jatrophihabitans sp. TaxID=1932789 RepID=UPI0030C6F9E8|nr:putative enoyl-CoA hydratase [Jatrophihabitans sp.]